MEHVGQAVNQKSFTLLEVMRSVQSVLQRTYANKSYWVQCELARISLHAQSGHCYLELIEKNENAILAQLKGIIWADKYDSITEKFKAVTNTPLAGGMKVLLLCAVSFHPVHGLSFNITDVEPSFTLGEMARMKNESVARLKTEGLFDKNRRMKMPLLPKRIAVISVETSRGYHDFMTTLQNHSVRYAIQCTLFEAILQGENAVPSLTRAMNNIHGEIENYDAIAIIRGGAGDAGLACYDEYALASVIARSSLPVISGIGHATNETVVEMIVHKNCITPTAAATFILDKFDVQNQSISETINLIHQSTKEFMGYQKQDLSNFSSLFCLLVQNRIERSSFNLKSIHAAMPSHVAGFLSLARQNLFPAVNIVLNVKRFAGHSVFLNELIRVSATLQQVMAVRIASSVEELSDSIADLSEALGLLSDKGEQINHIEEKVKLLDPVNTLMRGYSITRLNGKAVTDADKLKIGEQIETELANGVLISTIEKKN
jgi:exodeoxyribonuclease VII large subunit